MAWRRADLGCLARADGDEDEALRVVVGNAEDGDVAVAVRDVPCLERERVGLGEEDVEVDLVRFQGGDGAHDFFFFF